MNDSGFRPNEVFFQIVAIFINPTVSKTRYILHIMMTNREKDTRTWIKKDEFRLEIKS